MPYDVDGCGAWDALRGCCIDNPVGLGLSARGVAPLNASPQDSARGSGINRRIALVKEHAPITNLFCVSFVFGFLCMATGVWGIGFSSVLRAFSRSLDSRLSQVAVSLTAALGLGNCQLPCFQRELRPIAELAPANFFDSRRKCKCQQHNRLRLRLPGSITIP
jgi:hypothetical protein